MNVFHGKVVGIKDGQFGPWTPGVAVGGVVRTDDKFVTGAAGVLAVEEYDQYCIQTKLCTPVPVPAAKAYTNGDVYISVTKTWRQETGAVPGEPWLAGDQCVHLRAAVRRRALVGTAVRTAAGYPLPLVRGACRLPSAGFTSSRHGQGPGPARLRQPVCGR